jgi:N-acetylglucosamine repressor
MAPTLPFVQRVDKVTIPPSVNLSSPPSSVLVGDGKATQQHTKAHNDGLVLSTIYEAGAISRAAVARRTALSRTSVGDAVAELLARGLVDEIGLDRPRRGKPPILLRINPDARHLIGIDTSGSEFHGAVVNLRGEVRHQVSLPRESHSGAAALEIAYELLDRLVRAASAPLLGLGIGTPGLIDPQRGSHVHWAVNLDWVDLPLRELLEQRYGLPVRVVNDSHAAAMGEYFFGSPHANGNLVVIKCEQGLGAGIVLEGRLLHGDASGAGEIGHLVLAPDGRPCRCGNHGCLETLASTSAVIRAAGASDLCGFLQAYREGLAPAREAVADAGRALGMAVAMLVSTLNVRDVVIAGNLTQVGEPLLQLIREQVLQRCLGALGRATEVRFSAIGADLTVLGAAAVLLHQELGLWPLRHEQLASAQ